MVTLNVLMTVARQYIALPEILLLPLPDPLHLQHTSLTVGLCRPSSHHS